MKKTIFGTFLALALVLCTSMAATAADFTGVWRYEGLPGSSTITQDGNVAYVTGYHALDGNPAGVISYGIGVVEGNTMKIQFKVVRRTNPDWGGKSGITLQNLTLSPDGNNITGTWSNDSGSGQAARMIRVH